MSSASVIAGAAGLTRARCSAKVAVGPAGAAAWSVRELSGGARETAPARVNGWVTSRSARGVGWIAVDALLLQGVDHLLGM